MVLVLQEKKVWAPLVLYQWIEMHIIFAFTVDDFLEIWRIRAAHFDDNTFGL